MGTRCLLIVCVIILAICEYDHFVIGVRGGGRSRASSTRSSGQRTTVRSRSHTSSGSLWDRIFGRGNSATTATASARKAQVPPALSHRNSGPPLSSHAGFSKYGSDYEANFHNVHSQRQYTPVPHPLQRHFHPQTTG